MQNPLITVGIPAYNHAKFLAKALDSATKQTYSNLENISLLYLPLTFKTYS
jgi:glycosyltransferase involved in cell wall biosynthesis